MGMRDGRGEGGDRVEGEGKGERGGREEGREQKKGDWRRGGTEGRARRRIRGDMISLYASK